MRPVMYKNLEILEPTYGRGGRDLVPPPGLQMVKLRHVEEKNLAGGEPGLTRVSNNLTKAHPENFIPELQGTSGNSFPGEM